MADLITQLAARTLGLAPVLQPRIAPMFALEPGGLGNDGVEAHAATEASVSHSATGDVGLTSSALAQSSRLIASSRLTPLVTPDRPTLAISHLPRPQITSPQASVPPSFEPVSQVEPSVTPPINLPDEAGSIRSLNTPPSPTPLVQPPTELSVSNTAMNEQSSIDLPSPRSTAASLTPSTPSGIQSPHIAGDDRRTQRDGDTGLKQDSPRHHNSPASLQPRPSIYDQTLPQHPSVHSSTQSVAPVPQVSGESESQHPAIAPSQKLPPTSASIHQSTPTQPTVPVQPLVDRVNPSLMPQVNRDVVRSPEASTITPQTIQPRPIPLESAGTTPPNPSAPLTPLVSQTISSVNPRLENNFTQSDAGVTARSAQRQEQQAPDLPAPTPTIHITIGRIDIRAVPAPTPTRPRPTQTPPKISLQDYLNSRNGGGG